MATDFDQVIDRVGSDCLKFDKRALVFGRADAIPLWVADTDFAVPAAISAALQARLEHPILGYSFYPESLYEALIGWFARKHQVAIKREWLVFAPGVMTSVAAFIRATTQEGEGVVVQPPVYHSFFSAIARNKRRQLDNPLSESAGDYQMDMAGLAQLAKHDARALIFCSPHNPVGRVWQADELNPLLALARREKLAILSDDIHCDLVYPGARHQFLFELADEDDLLVTAIAPNKTFNTPALGLSALIIKNPQLRRALQIQFDQLLLGTTNPLSSAALGAAYGGQADEWHTELMAYLQANRDTVQRFFADRSLGIRANCPQGTYLSWLDCRALGLSDSELKRFFTEVCGLALSAGTDFGAGGSGFMRLNLGTRRAVIDEALYRIEQALAAR